VSSCDRRPARRGRFVVAGLVVIVAPRPERTADPTPLDVVVAVITTINVAAEPVIDSHSRSVAIGGF